MDLGGGRRLVVVVVAVTLLAGAVACGSSGTTASDVGTSDGGPEGTTIDPATAAYWVAGDLPDSFGPVLLTEDANGSIIYYAPAGTDQDLYDSPLRVILTTTDPMASTGHTDAEPVDVDDHDATLAQLSDEGRPSGFAVSWQQAPGRWLMVEGLSELSRDEVMAVARDLRPVDAAEWDRLRRALSIDTKVGKPDPAATPVDVISDTIDGETYTLTALIPSGYPLGADDQRRTCYRLTFRGASSGDRCDTHPWWMRIGGHLFVFGPADPGTDEVTIGPYRNQVDEPFTVPTALVDQGPPTAFYVAPLDDGRCYVTITPASDRNLGDIGPLPGDPEQAACLAQLRGG
ncbi:MAG: hypothetical protein ACXWB2_05630 [Acidimicrobiales bacterium]